MPSPRSVHWQSWQQGCCLLQSDGKQQRSPSSSQRSRHRCAGVTPRLLLSAYAYSRSERRAAAARHQAAPVRTSHAASASRAPQAVRRVVLFRQTGLGPGLVSGSLYNFSAQSSALPGLRGREAEGCGLTDLEIVVWDRAPAWEPLAAAQPRTGNTAKAGSLRARGQPPRARPRRRGRPWPPPWPAAAAN